MTSEPAPPFAVLRNLGLRFPNGTAALQNLDLAIMKGSFVSLLGQSGCGKSTVLRMLAGLARPSSGSIEFPGTGSGETSIGFVFQDPTLMPWRSALKNVMLPLRLAGIPKEAAADRAQRALSSVGLAGFLHAYPGELSGGMKMRVAIARAIVTRPDLLLLDEPFAALDEITRFRLNQDLLKLWEQERFTTVFVTHSVSEAVFLSQRICIMAARPGRIVGDYGVDIPVAQRDGDLRADPVYHSTVTSISNRLQGACMA